MNSEQAILDSLRALGDGLDELRRDQKTVTATVSEIKTDLAVVSADVSHTKELAEATNGRLRSVEKWRAKVEGAMFAVRGLSPLLAGLASIASVVAVVIAVTQA